MIRFLFTHFTLIIVVVDGVQSLRWLFLKLPFGTNETNLIALVI
jgi:hypothetical protein